MVPFLDLSNQIPTGTVESQRRSLIFPYQLIFVRVNLPDSFPFNDQSLCGLFGSCRYIFFIEIPYESYSEAIGSYTVLVIPAPTHVDSPVPSYKKVVANIPVTFLKKAVLNCLGSIGAFNKFSAIFCS